MLLHELQYISMFFNMSFAENLKRIRVQKGFTLDLLQEKTGISKRIISGYESGENDITLRKLQNFSVPITWNGAIEQYCLF